MSFNFLPDELIAQVSSHLDYKDILSLLETQKRINRILKHYEMDKPVVQELLVINKPLFMLTRILKDEQRRKVNLWSEETNNLATCLSKFRSVGKLSFEYGALNDDDIRSVLRYKGKIEFGSIHGTKLCFSPENFVLLCKKIYKIRFEGCECYEQYLNDNLLGQIVSSTNVEIDNTPRNKEEGVVFNLSDKFLEDILAGTHSEDIYLDSAYSSFTVKGIRRFVEECMHRGNRITYYMGILNKEQEYDARAWYEYLKEHPELGYRVGEYDRPRVTYCIARDSPTCSIFFEIANNV